MKLFEKILKLLNTLVLANFWPLCVVVFCTFANILFRKHESITRNIQIYAKPCKYFKNLNRAKSWEFLFKNTKEFLNEKVEFWCLRVGYWVKSKGERKGCFAKIDALQNTLFCTHFNSCFINHVIWIRWIIKFYNRLV